MSANVCPPALEQYARRAPPAAYGPTRGDSRRSPRIRFRRATLIGGHGVTAAVAALWRVSRHDGFASDDRHAASIGLGCGRLKRGYSWLNARSRSKQAGASEDPLQKWSQQVGDRITP